MAAFDCATLFMLWSKAAVKNVWLYEIKHNKCSKYKKQIEISRISDLIKNLNRALHSLT